MTYTPTNSSPTSAPDVPPPPPRIVQRRPLRHLHLLPHRNPHPQTHRPRLRKHPHYLLQNAGTDTHSHLRPRTTKTKNSNTHNTQQTLVEHIHSTKQHTYDTIHTAKQETLDFVNRFFDEKEKDITRRIEAEQKKQGLHNENRMDTLNNTISRDINALYAAATDLNSNNFL